ncbi:MAG: hypothetical protein GY821_17860 [Gammaproteobacteria bacterium]|nr:hypothetical protein [Gammaproteobacteria bacterium]
MVCYYCVVSDSFDSNLGVGILRLPQGLDFSSLMQEYNVGDTQNLKLPEPKENPLALLATKVTHCDSLPLHPTACILVMCSIGILIWYWYRHRIYQKLVLVYQLLVLFFWYWYWYNRNCVIATIN